MIPVIGAIVSAIGAPIGEWLKGVTARRRIKEEGKVRIEVAKIEQQLIVQKQAGSYDVESQRQMQFSWKDEYLVIVFTIPLIFSFLSPFIDFILLMTTEEKYTFSDKIPAAWQAVALAPDWYQWSLMGIIAATFGLRWLWSKSPPLPKK